jgi:hypothetical protein
MTADDDGDLSPFLEALDRAHDAQTRYDTARQLAAKGVEEANPDVERVRFQQLVIEFWRRLRPFIRMELPQYHEEVTLYGEEDGEINGLQQLHHFQGAVNTSQSFSSDGEIEQTTDAALLPPSAVRNALTYLTECAYHLEFMPEANSSRKIGNVDVFEAGEDGDPAALMRQEDEDEQRAKSANS